MDVAAAAKTEIDVNSLKEREEIYDCNRFIYITEGTGTLYIQGNATPLVKGLLCVLLAGRSHRISVDPDQKMTLQWCHFHSSYEDRDLYRTLKIPSYIPMIDEEGTSRLFDLICQQLLEDKLTSRLRIKATMLEIISNYLDSLPQKAEEEAPSEDLQKIDIILQYIDEHLADNITVEDLAKQVYLHPNYFIVFFKGILGHSPIQYVNLRRMEIAKNLLLTPGSNVSAVAKKVGMQIYYFSRMFKAHTGLTPSRFRKQGTHFASASNSPVGGEDKEN